MNQHEIERAIDAAAGAMITREPSRSLGYNVMARVRQADAPSSRRFVWVTAAASLAVCGTFAIAVMSRTPATVFAPPRAAQMPIGKPAVLPEAALAPVQEASPTRRTSVAAVATTKAVAYAALPPNDAPSIEPLRTEPIVLSSIDVPQLEHESTAIDTLNIELLTIEPLAASND